MKRSEVVYQGQIVIGKSLLGIAVLAGLLGGCGKSSPAGGFMGGMTVQVVAVHSVRQPVSEKISLVGTLAANEFIEIKSEIDGRVEQIDFEEGQRASKGQVLFKIDEQKLQASMSQAQANLNLAETTAKRYKALIESRAISQQEYDQVMASLATNQAEVELIKAQLHDATILAAFDGVMGQRLVSAGQFITKGTSLGFLINQDPIKAEFKVPERYLSQIKEGQDIDIRVAAYPDDVFSGKVYFIDPKIEESTRTALLKALIPNPDGKLRLGMFSNLDLIVAKRQAIVIPEIAVIVKGDTTSVFVVDEKNTAHLRRVATGIRLTGSVEITEGLQEGDIVVTEGFQKLREGAGVKMRFEEQPPAAAAQSQTAPEKSQDNQKINGS